MGEATGGGRLRGGREVPGEGEREGGRKGREGGEGRGEVGRGGREEGQTLAHCIVRAEEIMAQQLRDYVTKTYLSRLIRLGLM